MFVIDGAITGHRQECVGNMPESDLKELIITPVSMLTTWDRGLQIINKSLETYVTGGRVQLQLPSINEGCLACSSCFYASRIAPICREFSLRRAIPVMSCVSLHSVLPLSACKNYAVCNTDLVVKSEAIACLVPIRNYQIASLSAVQRLYVPLKTHFASTQPRNLGYTMDNRNVYIHAGSLPGLIHGSVSHLVWSPSPDRAQKTPPSRCQVAGSAGELT